MMEGDFEEADGPDFSTLPDVVWVRILRNLTLAERARVAETCHLLYDAFNHPSLWDVQTLLFMGESDNFTRKAQNLVYSPNYVALTKQFGKYFQNLTIKIEGHFRSMPKDLQELLEEVARSCRLETLVIDAGKIASIYNKVWGFPPKYTAVKALASFVQNAFRMRHLHIRSWPMYDDMDTQDCNIFKVLAKNEKLRKTLETLMIFWLEEQEWSEREPILFSEHVDAMVRLVGCFRNLTTLGLRTPMLSQELLEVLASTERVKLQLLKIVVHYIDPTRKPQFRIPQIESSAWQSLVRRNPDFRVECTVFLNTPNMELSNMLTPEVPLSAFSYMKYAKIDPYTLVKLHTQYKGTLTKFHSFCDSYSFDEDLILIAQRCPNLTEFIYHGEIHSNTVIEIAKVNGATWRRFQVREEKIKVPSEFDNVDEDAVLAHGPDGELVQVALMRFHQPEEEREEALKLMTSEVSSAIGTSWKPLK